MSSNWRATGGPTPTGRAAKKKNKPRRAPKTTPKTAPEVTKNKAPKKPKTTAKSKPARARRAGSGKKRRSASKLLVPLVALAVLAGVIAGFTFLRSDNTGDSAAPGSTTAPTTQTRDSADDEQRHRLTAAVDELNHTLDVLGKEKYLDVAGEYDFGGDIGVREITGGYRSRDHAYAGAAIVDHIGYSMASTDTHDFVRTTDKGWAKLRVGGDKETTWAVWNRGDEKDNPGMMTPPMLRAVAGEASGVNAAGAITFTSGYTARTEGDTIYVTDNNGRAYVMKPSSKDTAKTVEDYLSAATSTPYIINDHNELRRG